MPQEQSENIRQQLGRRLALEHSANHDDVMPNDPRFRTFLIHLSAYVVVVGLLAALNLLTNPSKLWFLWVLAGWGIGVAAHGLALLLQRTRRRGRIFIDPKARAFAVHLFAYVAVVILLLAVNLIVTPEHWWFYWVAIAWGIGVAAHGWCVFVKHRRPPSGSANRGKTSRRPRSRG